MILAIRKAFVVMGVDFVELSEENETLNIKRGTYVEKRLEESKRNLLQKIDDEKRAN